jgi:hypothetical protein
VVGRAGDHHDLGLADVLEAGGIELAGAGGQGDEQGDDQGE